MLTTSHVYAQLSGQAKIDSLLAELPKAKGDTNEVKLLTDLSFKYFSINPDLGIEYGEKAIDIAERINYQVGLAQAYNNIGVNYAGGKADYKNALIMYKKALTIYEEIKYKSGIGPTLNNIALIYQFEGDLSKAIEYFQQSADLAKENNNRKGYAGALNNIGNIFVDWGEYAKSLSYFQRSMKIYTEIENQPGISFCYTNIGSIYKKMSDYKNALDNYKKSLMVQKKIGDKRGVANSKNNIGILLVEMERYEEAKEYLLESLNYFSKFRNEESISNVYTNLGILEKQQSNYKESLEFFEKTYRLSLKKSNRIRVASAIANIGSVYYSMATDTTMNVRELYNFDKRLNLNRSINYFEEAIEIYKEEGELYNRLNFSKDLSNAYEIIGKKDKALEYYKEYNFLQDSIFNIEKTQKIAALSAEINLIEKDKEIEKQKLKIAEQEKREKLILYFSIGFILVMAVVMLIIYRLLKRSDKLLYNVLPVSYSQAFKKQRTPHF